MKFLYFDCFCGFDNEMALASLIDIGVNPEFIQNELNKNGFNTTISVSNVKRSQIDAKALIFSTDTDDEIVNYKQIKTFIEQNVCVQTKQRLIASFNKIAEAKAKIANIKPEQTTYSKQNIENKLAKMFAVFTAVNAVAPDNIICSAICEGSGMVRNEHFISPIPKPVTLEIIKRNRMPLKTVPISSELITSDGAALLGTIVKEYGTSPQSVVLSVGYGAGKQELELPNILRTVLAETEEFNLEELEMQILGNIDEKQELNV